MVDFLKNLKYSYGRNECVDELLNKKFSQSSSNINELQEEIVNYILNDEFINKYVTNLKYKKKFLKTLINSVENTFEEVNSVIFEKYIELIQNSENEHSTSYFRIYYSKVKRERDRIFFYKFNYF
jgi:hypothetical protein